MTVVINDKVSLFKNNIISVNVSKTKNRYMCIYIDHPRSGVVYILVTSVCLFVFCLSVRR